jgi:ADP-ribose pyrophosphatase
MHFELVKSETVYQGKVFNVRQDHLRLPDGKVTRLDVVEHSGAVTILPIDDQDQIWFIRQYRHPASRILLELPAGVMDEGEDPLESAQRELQEEIGMAADSLTLLGDFYLAPGYSTEYMYVFLARGLLASQLQPDEGVYIQIEKVPLAQAMSLVKAGRICDSKSLATLLLWKISNSD